MDPDYRDAADRHWQDAKLLVDFERLANADHLFGLAAECALKAVMVSLGMSMNEGKPAEKRHQVHINHLWGEFLAFVATRESVGYASILLLGGDNPFSDWHVAQRYGPQSLLDRPLVDRHAEAAGLTMRCLHASLLDGA